MPEPKSEMWLKSQKVLEKSWTFYTALRQLLANMYYFESREEQDPYNYKKICSIVLLVVVDANYKFIVVDAVSYGKNSDDSVLDHKSGKCLKIQTLKSLVTTGY